MIPPEIRLFTWLDAEDVITNARENGTLPIWFLGARAYWDGLTVTVAAGRSNDAERWLTELFDPRITTRNGRLELALEGLAHVQRALPVLIEEGDSGAPSAPILSFGAPPLLLLKHS
jgi:hypothetical protein